MLVPPEVGSVPLFIIMKKWTDQQPLVFSYPKNCNSSWYLLHEPVYHRCSGWLVEAARIDGCTDLVSLWRSSFRLSSRLWLPGVRSHWSKMEWLLLAITLLKKTGKIHIDGNHFLTASQWRFVYTMACYPCRYHISYHPIIILYLILERFQKAGMMEGAVKG